MQVSWQDNVQQYVERCQQLNVRAIIHIAGQLHWAQATTQALLNLLPQYANAAVFLAKQNAQQLQQQLGTECRCVVLDAYAGLNPNALGMVSASLQGGGVFIIVTPEQTAWSNYNDPDYARLLGNIDAQQAVAGLFLQRSVNYLWQCSSRLLLSQSTESNVQAPYLPDHSPQTQQRLFEQNNAIEQIKRVATGHSKRPLVLLADRGRGKSSALGIACAQLMQEKNIQIAITSVSQSSLERFFHHLGQTLNQTVDNNCIIYQNSTIRFYAIDELLQTKPTAQLLIIEEAAAIPVSLLQQCSKLYHRVVFSTTVNGYEGNGRGFELRFLPLLQSMMPQTKKLTLKTPWRWCEGDALEILVNRLLLLDAQLTPLTQQDVSAQTTIVELNRRDLLVNEALLEQIFALLVIAHYQTSPDDLRLLLDHPLLKVFVLLNNNEVLATALVMQEGDFTEDWQQKIESGRRGAGHILPQALFGDGFDVLDKRFWRVLRIAVRPELQNQGLGQQLLAYLKQHLQGDFLGASFSADVAVMAFWQKAGFQVCRLGSHKEAATGQYACIVLTALNPQSEVLLQIIRQEWAKKLPITLLSLNQDIETAVVPYLLHGLEFECSAKAKAQCQAFVEHRRSLEQVFADVHALLLHYLAKYPPSTQAQTAIEKVLLNHAWQTVAEKQSLTGRKNVEQQIRTSVQTMMQRLQEQKNE